MFIGDDNMFRNPIVPGQDEGKKLYGEHPPISLSEIIANILNFSGPPRNSGAT